MHFFGAGTELLTPRPFKNYLQSNDFTRPAGEVGETTFLGRPAWTVELAPPPHKPHPLQLVIDAETGVILQQRNDGFGTVQEWVEFVVGEPVPAGLFTWTGPARSSEEVRAERDAEHETDMARRRDWFAANVLAEPMRVEVDLRPIVHVHESDGSFEASLEPFGMLARRTHSDEPWELGWHSTDRRWSTRRWDWALAFHDVGFVQPESVAALIEQLSATDR